MPLYILFIILKMTGIKILYFRSVGLHLQKRSCEFRFRYVINVLFESETNI